MIHYIIIVEGMISFKIIFDYSTRELLYRDIKKENLFQEIAAIPEPPQVKVIANRKQHHAFINDFLPEFPEPHTYIQSSAICPNAYRSNFEEVKNSFTHNVRQTQDALAKFAAKMERKLRGNSDDGTIE